MKECFGGGKTLDGWSAVVNKTVIESDSDSSQNLIAG